MQLHHLLMGACNRNLQLAFFSSSQRSRHNAPIFRLLLKVAVKGTHQCDFTNLGNFWVPTSAIGKWSEAIKFKCVYECQQNVSSLGQLIAVLQIRQHGPVEN